MKIQNVASKQSCGHEQIIWICGFTNANGGKLYIDMDDSGNITGIAEAKNYRRTFQTKPGTVYVKLFNLFISLLLR